MRKKQLKAQLQMYPILAFVIGYFITYYSTKDLFISLVLGASGASFILIMTNAFISQKSKQILKSGIYEIDKMSGKQFEYYLSSFFKYQGYKVDETPTTRDFGADIVLKKDGKIIVVQAKRYSKNIGIQAVQEIVAAVAYYKASEAWVVTNRFFTSAAVQLAHVNQVRLIDRDELIKWILQVNPGAEISPSLAIESVRPDIASCPNCNHPLKVRKGKFGSFWGCSNYPACSFIYKGKK